jgi:hypothetical protein
MSVLVSFLSIVFNPSQTLAQCTFTSTSGYTVTVNATPVELNTPATCSFGYGYTLDIALDVSFSGANAPASMYNLQGNLYCGSQSVFFDINNSPGIDTVITANAWRNASDCNTATPTSLGCDSIRIQISGPGINNTTSNCPIPTPVPVKFLSLDVIQLEHKNIIRWQTASELNNHFFTVEQFTNELKWEAIEDVTGSGTTSSINSYSLDHLNPKDVRAYRIKQTDYDGKFDYSHTIPVSFIKKSIQIYPNPTQSKLSVFPLHQIDSTLKVFNSFGIDVTEFIPVRQLHGSRELDLTELADGIYYLKFASEYHRIIRK